MNGLLGEKSINERVREEKIASSWLCWEAIAYQNHVYNTPNMENLLWCH
jgi:hypothetical protein